MTSTIPATTEVVTAPPINNRWVKSKSGKRFPTFNPATGEEIAQVAEADAPDIDEAVQAARRAFEVGAWRKASGVERARLLNKLADLLEAHTDELAHLEALNGGKPIGVAKAADLALTVACYRYYAGWADKLQGKTIPLDGNYFCYTWHEPVGVVGQIIPWNYPLLMQRSSRSVRLGPPNKNGHPTILSLEATVF